MSTYKLVSMTFEIINMLEACVIKASILLAAPEKNAKFAPQRA